MRRISLFVVIMHYHSTYTHFDEEQFAADQYFQQWVLTADDATNEFWESFLNLYPEQRTTVQQARQLVQQLADNDYTIQPLARNEKAEIKRNIFQQLQLDDEGARVISYRKKYNTWIAAAAIIMAITATAFILFIQPVKQSGQQASFVEVKSLSEKKEIILPDSSVVILNAGSSLKYNDQFLAQPDREVFLEGNAFFEVKKESDHKRFIVHTQSLDVTVLGTQFNVDARSPATEVGLTSGKVKITRADNNGETFMLPGEKIKLDISDRSLSKTTFDTRLYSAWTENKWRFQQTTLEEVAMVIGQYYNVVPEFKNEKYKQLKITAVIPVTNLDMLMQVLSKTLHIQIHQENGRMIIS